MIKLIKIVILIVACYRFWLATDYWKMSKNTDKTECAADWVAYRSAYELNALYTIALVVFAFKFKDSDE